MLKYLLLISLLMRAIICLHLHAKSGEFSRHDAKHFIELLDYEKMPKIIKNKKGMYELDSRKEGIKFSKEFKIILVKLNERIEKEKANMKIMHKGGEMRELNDEEKEQLGVAYWHLFGSNLLDKLLEYSFWTDKVFLKKENPLLKYFGTCFGLRNSQKSMDELWEIFYKKVRDILRSNSKLKLDEKFVRDLAEKGKFLKVRHILQKINKLRLEENSAWNLTEKAKLLMALKKGNFGKMLAEKNTKNKIENGLEEAEIDLKEAAKKFPFTQSLRILDHFCTIINQVDLGDDAELKQKVEIHLGTFKCPEDNLALVELLRGTIFVLDKNERKNLVNFLTSHYFVEVLKEIHCDDRNLLGDFRDWLKQEGRWHIPLFWEMQKQMGQAAFRFLISKFFNPMFKLLSKFGDQCILKRSLFGHFLLEFAIELAREGDTLGEIRFQGREKPLYGKLVGGIIGVMPKQVADLMNAKFNGAAVQIRIIEEKLKQFVEKEKKKTKNGIVDLMKMGNKETKLKSWWRKRRKNGIVETKNDGKEN